ncbi:hypothetical protein H6F43_20755 [Leptolyngbya sp. FACHB-36]|uniref:hypothetical protein n=1 Tax=Leptolyngbya sp. FACHB-36 TaxID=2692808 RepID=UPI0016813956|nr:hypothetical protein [Leptolyngbya sp. FACHB-36]MBD2022617.1 hypothetical protein [Leptolyngbya sp. FACHB-36]
MTLLKHRAHQFIDRLSERELTDLWGVLTEAYYDLHMLQAIYASKQILQPGDTFTREEALRFLLHASKPNS